MKNFLLYAAGVVTGIAIGGYVFKKRYEEIMEEDRQSRKEVYGRCAEEPEEASSTEQETKDYKEVIAEAGYSGTVETEEEPEHEIIKPIDFDTLDDYNAITLTLYANGILCDDANDPMTEDEIEAAIGGNEALTHFGEYEKDAVYVRNNARKVDYEILREEEEYE